MKRIFVVLTLTLSALCTSAQIKVQKHTHSWAGGVCCAHGSDYTLTLKIPKGDWQTFDSVIVCTGTDRYSYSFENVSKRAIGDTLVVTVSYSYSWNEREHEIRIEDIDPLKTPLTCAAYLQLVKGYVRKELSIATETWSMTSYP